MGLSVSIRVLEMSKKNRIDLHAKTILITGAGSGIGAASARALYAKGANVVLLDLTDLGTKPLEKEFGSARSLALIADVTKRKQLDAAVKASVEKFGGIDIVFANAGIACDPPTTVRYMCEKTFEHVIEVDLFGVTRTVQACLPEIIKNKGHVLMTASTSAFINGIANVPYGIAKAGVEMFGRSLRAELARTGATAGVLLPCWTNTPIAANALGAHELSAKLVKRGFPPVLRKPITPETVARAVVKGMENRTANIFRPRRWAFISMARGIFNPITDRAIAKDKTMQDLIAQLEAETMKT